MASSSLFFFLFFLLFQQFNSQLTEFPPSIHLPVTKHGPTGHYLAQIHHSRAPTNLLLDLSSPLLWLHCSSSSSPTPLPCRSIQCSSATRRPCPTNSSIHAPPPCTLPLKNPITGATSSGHLIQDSLILNPQIPPVENFLFSCGPSSLLKSLPSQVKGVFGLGKSRTSPLSQISHSFEYPQQKFSLCLSPTTTAGGFLSLDKLGVSESEVMYTPLLPDHHIGLKSIRIHNKKLSLGLPSSSSPSLIRISTVSPFTQLETGIHRIFVRAFTIAAESLHMVRAPTVGPFPVCFESGSGSVPVIDLVLQSEMVKWRIHEHNSMVKVNEDVVCLGFLDGGSDLEGASVVLGGHQLEDNLLEFDLGSSMLGFSSSLVKNMGTTCSQLSSNHQDLQSL